MTYLIDALTKEGSTVAAYYPEAMENFIALLGDQISFATDEYAVLQGADALLICTEWGVFRNPDFDRVKSMMNDAVIFDGRNLFDLEEMTEKGFYYSSIGRNLVSIND